MLTVHRDEPKSQWTLHLGHTLCILWALSLETDGQHIFPQVVDMHAFNERECKILWNHIALWPKETWQTWVHCLHNEKGNLVKLREWEWHFMSYIARILWFQSVLPVAILHKEREDNNKEHKRMQTPRPSPSSTELFLGSNSMGPPVVSFHTEKHGWLLFQKVQWATLESSSDHMGLRTDGETFAKNSDSWGYMLTLPGPWKSQHVAPTMVLRVLVTMNNKY